MFAPEIPPIRPDDPIRASWLNQVRKAALWMLALSVEAPLDLMRTPAGLVLRLVHNPRIWIKVVSGAQPYAWRDLIATAGGGWADGLRSGTATLDPAYEQNGSTTVPAGIVVLARRAWGTGTLVFQLGPCSTNQPAPGITPGAPPTPGAAGVAPPPPMRLLPVPESFSGFPGGRAPLSTSTGGTG